MRIHWFVLALCQLDVRFWRGAFTATLALQRAANWLYGRTAYQLGLANKTRFEQTDMLPAAAVLRWIGEITT